MATKETIAAAKIGGEGDRCEDCGGPLADDQRYCLGCGTRRAGPRVPYREVLVQRSSVRPAPVEAVESIPGPGREWTPLTAVGLVAVIALILVAGVLIGRGNGKEVATQPQVLNLGDGAGDGLKTSLGGPASVGSFKSDWPSGKNGFTVELGVLEKAGTGAAAVEKAKRDATEKGATKVGALDSDQYPSLPGGNYVVYSGVYGNRAGAQKALKRVKADFPDAQVIKVSKRKAASATPASAAPDTGAKTEGTVGRQELDQLDSLGGDEYVKRSKKLPDTTKVEGAPPPKDNAAPGAGGEAIEIK